MKPDPRFLRQSKSFWAHVRSISQAVGYTDRSTKEIRVISFPEIQAAMRELSLGDAHLIGSDGEPGQLGRQLVAYFAYRAAVLNEQVRPLLMDAEEAGTLYRAVRKQLPAGVAAPMNKQRGKMKKPAFLTGIVNLLIDEHRAGIDCDFDPQQLTSITKDGVPIRTLARRVDGAFPSPINPVAIWEIKEYYYTTTFGSRVADGVYEVLLDGMELEELRKEEGVEVKHYLVLDGRFTWWDRGRSYLCRIIDMLHMGYVEEVLFGRETVQRLPDLVKAWVAICNRLAGGNRSDV